MGAAGNAFGTSSDGAIINSSGKYYVFAGARAFPIPSSAELSSLRRIDKAQVLPGHITTAQQNQGIASGVELDHAGTGLRDVPGEPVPVQVSIAAAHGRVRRYSGGTGPGRRRPARCGQLFRFLSER